MLDLREQFKAAMVSGGLHLLHLIGGDSLCNVCSVTAGRMYSVERAALSVPVPYSFTLL
jgi:hypothetical protein